MTHPFLTRMATNEPQIIINNNKYEKEFFF